LIFNIKHKKIILCLLAAISIFIAANIVKLDGRCYFRFCTEVFLDNCTNEDAKKLQTMPFINSLVIRNCEAENIDFVKNKKNLTNLSILKYSGDWAPLKNCNKLKSFDVTNSTFDNLTYFSEMEQLENLNFSFISYDVKIYSINGIEKLKSLRFLSLNGVKEENVSLIADLTALNTLSIMNSDISFLDIDLNELKYLALKNNQNIQTCSFSDRCVSLEEITIEHCSNIAININEIINLPKLKKVTVSKGVFTEKEIAELRLNDIKVELL